MQTQKNWVKSNNSIFTLHDNGQQIGTMEIAIGTMERKATVSFQNKEILIKRTGFWRSNLEISDNSGKIIAKIYPKKWYAHSYLLDYGDKNYELLIRNNPLAELTIQENNKDLISYGLTTQHGKASVKITTLEPNYLFDFILWYLFLPIATEQGANDLIFLALIA